MKTSSAKAKVMDKKYIELKLSNTDKVTIVDIDDYKRFRYFNWYLSSNGYVVSDVSKKSDARSETKKIRLHRLICLTPDGMDTDHINGNKLDNRKSNLRVCTRSNNLQNKRVLNKKSNRLTGAYLDKRRDRWFSAITIPNTGKFKHLGSFDSEEEAHLAYVAEAKILHGEFYRSKK